MLDGLQEEINRNSPQVKCYKLTPVTKSQTELVKQGQEEKQKEYRCIIKVSRCEFDGALLMLRYCPCIIFTRKVMILLVVWFLQNSNCSYLHSNQTIIASFLQTEDKVTEEMVDNLNTVENLDLVQKTPIRVLHRRSPLTRTKRIIK